MVGLNDILGLFQTKWFCDSEYKLQGEREISQLVVVHLAVLLATVL